MIREVCIIPERGGKLLSHAAADTAHVRSAEERACVHDSAEPCGMHQAWLRALGRGGGEGAWAGWRRLGGVEAGGQLLLEEHDEERFLEFTRSKDGQIVTINSSTKTSSEVRHSTALS